MNMGVACHDWCWKKGNMVFLSVVIPSMWQMTYQTLCLFAILYRTVFYVSFAVVNITVILWALLTVYLSLCLTFFLCCSCGFCHCWGIQECDGVKILVTLHVNFSHKLLTFSFIWMWVISPLFVFIVICFILCLFVCCLKCHQSAAQQLTINWTH